MISFTDEEYEIMIYELTEKEPMSYDMMCSIAYRILKPVIKSFCFNHSALKGRQFDDDLIQDIILRLMKYCVTHFLRRESNGFEINHNPVEFQMWVIRVGKNYAKTFAENQQKKDNKTRTLLDRINSQNDKTYTMKEEEIHKSVPAFRLAFYAPKNPHIVLTWITISVLMLYCDITKIKATRLMETAFSDKSLSEMWNDIQILLRSISWLQIKQDEIEHFNKRLDEIVDGNQPAGSIIYKDYFGERGGRAAISDWVYRMNSWIKTRLNNESFDN